MDSALYYKIYKERVDEQAILGYTKYAEPYHLYYLIKDYVWRA